MNAFWRCEHFSHEKNNALHILLEYNYNLYNLKISQHLFDY